MNRPLRITIYSDTDSRTCTYSFQSALKTGFEDLLRKNEKGFELQFMDGRELCRPGALDQETDLFILPGITGDDCHYFDHIREASPFIKSYLREGGTFLGTCAGAYYAMTDIEYLRADGTVKKRKSPLGLINGLAKGPVEGINVPREGNMDLHKCVARPLQLSGYSSIEGRIGRALYSCGPKFISELGKTFARYADCPERSSALIMHAYGKGLVIASGPCPQYNAADVGSRMTDAQLRASDVPAHNIAADLASYDGARRLVWNFILASAIKHRTNLANQPSPVLRQLL